MARHRRRAFALTAFAAWALASVMATAQVATKDARLHAFYRYGLDAVRVRVDRIARVAVVDGRPYVREHDPGDGTTGYLLLTLTLVNPGAAAENIPLFAVAVTLANGRTLDPAVYGPFVGNATDAAPASATLAPRRHVMLQLAVADIPRDATVAAIVLNPNGATAQYRLRPAQGDVVPLAAVPRRGAR